MSELFIDIVENLQIRTQKEYEECEQILWQFLERLSKEDVAIFMNSTMVDKIDMIVGKL